MSIKSLVKKFLPKKIVEKYYATRPLFSELSYKKKKRIVIKRFKRFTGGEIDWNNPKGFNEKMQIYKIAYYKPIMSKMVCKVNFKKYVLDELGSNDYTIPMYKAYRSADEIDWDELPDTFVLKSNCDCGGESIKFIKGKSNYDLEQVREEISTWFEPRNKLINTPARAYWDVEPLVLAEKYMEQFNEQLWDYKVFCFNGVPYCIYVSVDHFGDDDHDIVFYDLDWKKMDIKYGSHRNEVEIEKPKHLDQMIEIAQKLSKGFPFLRVDFFETEEYLYLAECTFYPGGGFTPYNPKSFDEELGKRFILPNECFDRERKET